MFIFIMVYLIFGMILDICNVTDEEIMNRGITSPLGVLATHAGAVVLLPAVVVYTFVKTIFGKLLSDKGEE